MRLFDSHAHYNDEKFDDDRNQVMKEIEEAGVEKYLIAGYNLESSQKALKLAGKGRYVSIGISPNDVQDDITSTLQELENLFHKQNYIVAVGEIGLDYYWNKENKDLQKEYFIRQIKLANQWGLPIIIHSRDAQMDTIQILKENACKKRGVFHCCQLNLELIKQALSLDYYISLAGSCTFKNAKNAEEVIKNIPLERMVIETDSPYLAPEPVRGTRNDSRNLKYIAEKIANVLQKPVEEIAEITYQNAEKLFQIQ